MTISRISDNHTRYLQRMERMAQTKAERISSTREKEENKLNTDDRLSPGKRESTVVDEERKQISGELEERKADRYASQIREYEREEKEKESKEDKAERLKNYDVVTPEDIRRGETTISQKNSEEDAASRREIETDAEDRSDTTNPVSIARDEAVGTERETTRAEEEKDEEVNEAEEKRTARTDAEEQSFSPQDAYDILSGNHVDSEFVIEMNTSRRLSEEADVLRGERDIDRMRGTDTTKKQEQIEELTGTADRGSQDTGESGSRINVSGSADRETVSVMLDRRAKQDFQVSVS